MNSEEHACTNESAFTKALIYIFNDLPVVPMGYTLPEFSSNDRISEIDTCNIILLTGPFIEGYAYMDVNWEIAKGCLSKFIDNIFTLYGDKEEDVCRERAASGLIVDSIIGEAMSNKMDNTMGNIARNAMGDAIPSAMPNNMPNTASSQLVGDLLTNAARACPVEAWPVHKIHLNTQPNLRGIWESIKERVYSRADVLTLRKIIRKFNFDYIDWNDREFLLKMIKYSLCKSIMLYNRILNEEAARASISDTIPGKHLRIYQVGSIPENQLKFGTENLGLPIPGRRELLSRRNKPMMSLEEFANFVVANMNKREQEAKEARSIQQRELTEEEQRSIAIKEDEFNDTRRNNLGNIKHKG